MNIKDQNNSGDMEFMDFESLKSIMRGEEVTEVIPAAVVPVEEPIIEGSSLKGEEIIETKEKVDLELESEKSKGTDSEISIKNRERLKKLYGNKLQTVIQDVDGQDVEVPLDEIEIDDETFEELLLQGKQLEIEHATKGMISNDGISGVIEQIIEINKNGGDITEVLNAQKYTQSLDSIDINTPEGQKHAIYLVNKWAGMPEDVIADLIAGYTQSGTLAEKGMSAGEKVKENVDKFIEDKRLQAIQDRKDKEEKLKTYKKELGVKLTETFDINDSFRSKLIDFSSKPDAEGKFEIDKIYVSYRQDPVKSAKLALFLNNMEEYDKQVSNGQVIQEKLELAGKARLTNRGQAAITPQKKEVKSEDFQSFDEINSKTKH